MVIPSNFRVRSCDGNKLYMLTSLVKFCKDNISCRVGRLFFESRKSDACVCLRCRVTSVFILIDSKKTGVTRDRFDTTHYRRDRDFRVRQEEGDLEAETRSRRI